MLRHGKVCVLYHKLVLLKDACTKDRIVPVKDIESLIFIDFSLLNSANNVWKSQFWLEFSYMSFRVSLEVRAALATTKFSILEEYTLDVFRCLRPVNNYALRRSYFLSFESEGRAWPQGLYNFYVFDWTFIYLIDHLFGIFYIYGANTLKLANHRVIDISI